MSVDKVKAYFKSIGVDKTIIEPQLSSATVELAAAALGCEAARIAKTLSFYVEGKPILIVAAGDVKVDNHKYREQFHEKAHMIPSNEVEQAVGHAPGGVCPFAVNNEVKTYLDVSLKRFTTVFPAAGSGNSAVEFMPDELAVCAKSLAWIDVCKLKEENANV